MTLKQKIFWFALVLTILLALTLWIENGNAHCNSCPPPTEPVYYPIFMPMVVNLQWECVGTGDGGYVCGPLPMIDE